MLSRNSQQPARQIRHGWRDDLDVLFCDVANTSILDTVIITSAQIHKARRKEEYSQRMIETLLPSGL